MPKIVYVPSDCEVIVQNFRTLPEVAYVKDISDFPESVFMGGWNVNRGEFLNCIKIIAAERKMTAIKWVHNCTNWELKESREFVEYLMETYISWY